MKKDVPTWLFLGIRLIITWNSKAKWSPSPLPSVFLLCCSQANPSPASLWSHTPDALISLLGAGSNGAHQLLRTHEWRPPAANASVELWYKTSKQPWCVFMYWLTTLSSHLWTLAFSDWLEGRGCLKTDLCLHWKTVQRAWVTWQSLWKLTYCSFNTLTDPSVTDIFEAVTSNFLLLCV